MLYLTFQMRNSSNQLVVRLPAAEFNLASAIERVAQVDGGRAAIVSERHHLSYAEFVDRGRRLAALLHRRGLGCRTERDHLAGHEVGQDLVAQLLYNSSEYLEGILGAARARSATINLNYRYTAAEMRSILLDAAPAAIQYHARFAPMVAELVASVPSISLLLQVPDDSGAALLEGAVDYHAALAHTRPDVDIDVSADDVHVIFTGGTTGSPRGVIWRQGDAIPQAMGVRNQREDREWRSIEERVACLPRTPRRVLPAAPFMHGAGQWAALKTLIDGHTVVIQSSVERFDPADIWNTVSDFGVHALTIVGDAFARPLLDELEQRPDRSRTLRTLISGGSALHHTNKARFTSLVPGLTIVDTMGSSETGPQAQAITTTDHQAVEFRPNESTLLASDDLTEFISPDDDALGWIASAGRVPLGYLNDEAKSARTFPTIDGVRVAIPGDRARWAAGGKLRVLGRDSVTINTGGEKVFAEEVEAVLKLHEGLVDVLVCGRPNARWGNEVVAIVELRPGAAAPSLRALKRLCAKHLAAYKHPRAVIVVPHLQRGASGKPDYAWAAMIANDVLDDPGVSMPVQPNTENG